VHLLLARGERERPVGRPLAPRARVEDPAKARQVQRQEVVAGVDPRAAVDDRRFARGTGRLVAPPQRRGRPGTGPESGSPSGALFARARGPPSVDRLRLPRYRSAARRDELRRCLAKDALSITSPGAAGRRRRPGRRGARRS
jgi:hypothetical protein